MHTTNWQIFVCVCFEISKCEKHLDFRATIPYDETSKH
jgi:hypothetical protein